MTPEPSERDALFKSFGRAFFKADAALLASVVTPDFRWLSSDGLGGVREIVGVEAAVVQILATRERLEQRFHDVVYHHGPDMTFMTFRLTERDKATGAVQEQVGVERYAFRDGRIAVKDVYRKRL